MNGAGRPCIGLLGGTGAEGRGLALRWCAAGYRVVIGSRDAERAGVVAEEIAGRLAGVVGATAPTAADNPGAARAGEVVVLAVPYAAQADTLATVLPMLDGKVLVTVVAPLTPPRVSTVHLPPGGSAAAEAQAQVGSTVRVVAAFQNVAASRLADLGVDVGCDILVCGDDSDAKSTVLALVAATGADGYDAGPLANAVVPEGLTPVLIGINRRYGTRDAGVRIINVGRSRPDSV